MLVRSFCLKLATGLLLAALSLAAGASAFEDFTEERLAELNAGGGPVLVEVHAPWCSTCRRQAPILERLLGDPEFRDLTGLRLDWDTQRAQARALGAPRQSTLILLRDGQVIDRSVAETDPDKLRVFLARAFR